MATFLEVLQAGSKGATSIYRPGAGTVCEISGLYCYDGHAYVFDQVEILWADGTFVAYRKPGCLPKVLKWEHVICRPVKTEIRAK